MTRVAQHRAESGWAKVKAAKLEAEEQRLDRQNKCNDQWLDYKNAVFKKQIAELRGQVGRTPVEPFCTGYAPRLDQSMDLIFQAGEAWKQYRLEDMRSTNGNMPPAENFRLSI